MTGGTAPADKPAAGAGAVAAPGAGTRGGEPSGVTRRRFLGYVLAGPTLVAAAQLRLARTGAGPAPVPSPPELADYYDLNDLLTQATLPTADLVTVTINPDGTASFALPRNESGQGITTSSAMIIAEELDLPLERIRISLADARPELVFNQFTAGSNTTISTFTPFRVAAAVARRKLLEAAAIELGDTVTDLETEAGVVSSRSGRRIGYGALAARAAATRVQQVAVTLKPRSSYRVIGTPQRRIDALEAVTGRKQFTMDLDVPDAWPTMICRAPTIKGTVRAVLNADQVRQMPGVTDVAVISSGVAVRARTFGQCIDAVRALRVSWGPGTVEGQSDETVLTQLRAAQAPLPPSPPGLAPGARTLEREFTFYWKSNSALEPNTAIADVRGDRAEIWSSMQSPILAQEQVARLLGLPPGAVRAHVIPGGGAFGRRMFTNVVLEAAEASRAMGKPVRLMWDRTAEFRAGRVHPMCISKVRATYAGGSVLSFEQRHTSVATDYTQGFGEILLATAAQAPPMGAGNYYGFSQSVFELTVEVPYDFGTTDQALTEIFAYDTFNTGSVRNLYNADVVVAVELMVEELAAAMGTDPYRFRRAFLKDDRSRAVLDAVAKAGRWGRPMAPGTAQGIAFHREYKGVSAALVEIDARPATVHRHVRDAVTGPRVTKVVFAVDVGLAINPLGLQAQMMGGVMDAIGQVLTESLHLRDGYFLEGSWDNYFYSRQWNTPLELEVIVMPPSTGEPGGAGEFGVAAAKSAVACAYARATGRLPTSFPVNHDGPLAFTPYPTVPPVPQSPTDGLRHVH